MNDCIIVDIDTQDDIIRINRIQISKTIYNVMNKHFITMSQRNEQ